MGGAVRRSDSLITRYPARIFRLVFRSPHRSAPGYDAFVSYSHLADDALAATLQAGLETFATPWFRSRTLRVFRDTTDLAATPGLLSEIIGALSNARWFILVASERAASSRWVTEEVSWWLDNRDHKRFLIALSDGEIAWAGRDFDWEHTTALPAVLAGAFTEEPGWIDLRDVKRVLTESDDASAHARARRLARYRARRQVGDWVAALAAPIRGVAKDTLVGEHLRYRKSTRRMVQAVLAVMLILTIAASAAAAVAKNQLTAARTQARIATSRELAALSENLLTRHLDLAELLAVEAYRLNPSGQALAALFQAVTASPHLVTYLSIPGLHQLDGSSGTFGNEYVAALSPGGKFISDSMGISTLPVWDIAKHPVNSLLPRDSSRMRVRSSRSLPMVPSWSGTP
jgi:TIR domain-containing protein